MALPEDGNVVVFNNVSAKTCEAVKCFMEGYQGDFKALLQFLERRNTGSFIDRGVGQDTQELVVEVSAAKVDELHSYIGSTMMKNKLQSLSSVIDFLVLGCGMELKEDGTLKIASQKNQSMLKKLNDFRLKNLFCDVDLYVGDGINFRYSVHRCALAARSDFFMDIFQNGSTVITLSNISQKNVPAFEDVLEFLYTGDITIQRNNCMQLLEMAKILRITELKQACEDYLTLVPQSTEREADESLPTEHANGEDLDVAEDESEVKTLVIVGGPAPSEQLKDQFDDLSEDDLLLDVDEYVVQSDSPSNTDGENQQACMSCGNCGGEFSSWDALGKHMNTCSRDAEEPKSKPARKKCRKAKRGANLPKRRFSCKECGSWFNSKSHMQRHMISHTGERRHCCTTCGKLFLKADHLTRHEMSHSSERPFGCSMCEKRFKNKQNMQRHERIHTGERLFFCELCGKQFRDSTGLQIHQKYHGAERVCPICGKCFKQRNRLEYHISWHQNPPSCVTCGKTFKFQTQLRKHMITHSGVRPFNCETCGKQFCNANSLRVHQKKHTGIGLHACHLCDKKFLNNFHLQRHIKTHSGDKPYKCDICCRAYSRYDNCMSHKRLCQVRSQLSNSLQTFTESGVVSEQGDELKIKRVKRVQTKSLKKHQGEARGDSADDSARETMDIALAVHDDELAGKTRYKRVLKKKPEINLLLLENN